MHVFTDQTGRKVELNKTPARIVSLVPSQTELLYDLGLEDEVIGITKFCVHPSKWFKEKTKVGGTKQLKIEIIHQLQPDLIIANKEENVKEQIEELQKHYPVWISDVDDLDDAYKMILQIGVVTGKQETSEQLVLKIKENFIDLPIFSPKLKTAYLIWRNPYMTVGGDTFIHAMLGTAGFENIFANKKRYPHLTINDLLIANCQLLLLPSEPFPFKQKHIAELHPLLTDTKIVLVDGEIFSWYGSRLLSAPAYFADLHRLISNTNSR